MKNRAFEYRVWHDKPIGWFLSIISYIFAWPVGMTYYTNQFPPNKSGIIQEFTGAIDLKKKKIFEYDIVKIYSGDGKHKLFVVTFNNGNFYIGGGLVSDFCHHCEVVGNVFENPDMEFYCPA